MGRTVSDRVRLWPRASILMPYNAKLCSKGAFSQGDHRSADSTEIVGTPSTAIDKSFLGDDSY